jgi:signal transduction histidine kinase
MSSLAERVGGIEQGQHLCLLYEESDEQFDAAVPFLAEGLRRGERCVYGAGVHTLELAREKLQAAGIDVAAQIEGGALLLRADRDTFLRREPFDPEEMIAFLARSVSAALAEGFTGVRTAGVMTWALDSGTRAGDLVRYEALLNDFYSGSRATGLCQYDKRAFSAELQYDVICTHPMVIHGRQLCRNHFYEAPPVVLAGRRKVDRLPWRLARLVQTSEAEETLQEALRLRSEFLAAMSHDLRIPLNAILGYSALLETGVTGALTPAQRAQVSRIYASARHLAEMIDDILTFERTEAAREEAEPERFTLAPLMEETYGLVAQTAKEKGLLLQVDLPPEQIWLWTDRKKLCKILLNLLSNAVKFTESGGIRFSAFPENDREDRRVVFTVSDTGRGIPADQLESIFEPFWRVKGDTVSGTGLGLTLTRRMARLLGGDVSVESRPGEGSTFTVRIPEAIPPVEGRSAGAGSRGRREPRSWRTRLRRGTSAPGAGERSEGTMRREVSE